MTVFLTAFLCAITLAVIVIIFIAYCMFCKERHKSERFQYDITDLRRTNIEIAQEHAQKTKEVTAGVFVLARKRRKDDQCYHKRPDYPEGPVTIIEPRTDQLIQILNDPESPNTKCVAFDEVPYHSEV